jgi:putative glutamine amidotransferase
MNRYARPALALGDAAALLVPNLSDLMTAREVAPRLDGLMLTGSPSNLDPERYGEAGSSEADGPFDPGRDAMTAGLIEAMVEAGKPVFGICRGIQEINVAFGGTLRRDASSSADLMAHHAPVEAGFEDMFEHVHEVSLVQGGVLNRRLDADKIMVNSVHYQALDRLGEGLRAEAHAPDGVIEAVAARPNGAPVLAVQWHPEWRWEERPASAAFFRLMGEALRGELEAF